MHGEVGGSGEALVALGAREQLLASVLGHVDAQLCAVGAALSAHRARESENNIQTFVTQHSNRWKFLMNVKNKGKGGHGK